MSGSEYDLLILGSGPRDMVGAIRVPNWDSRHASSKRETGRGLPEQGLHSLGRPDPSGGALHRGAGTGSPGARRGPLGFDYKKPSSDPGVADTMSRGVQFLLKKTV